jgi:hypothetical protein
MPPTPPNCPTQLHNSRSGSSKSAHTAYPTQLPNSCVGQRISYVGLSNQKGGGLKRLTEYNHGHIGLLVEMQKLVRSAAQLYAN